MLICITYRLYTNIPLSHVEFCAACSTSLRCTPKHLNTECTLIAYLERHPRHRFHDSGRCQFWRHMLPVSFSRSLAAPSSYNPCMDWTIRHGCIKFSSTAASHAERGKHVVDFSMDALRKKTKLYSVGKYKCT